MITAQTVHATTFVFMHDKTPSACSNSNLGSMGARWTLQKFIVSVSMNPFMHKVLGLALC